MTPMFLEYPKSLYWGGDVLSDSVLVFDQAEEQKRRKDGYLVIGEPLEKSEEPRKRGRPKKVTDGTV